MLVDCSGEGEKTPESAYENKKKALLQLVEQQPVSKTILFCNKVCDCLVCASFRGVLAAEIFSKHI